MWKSSFWCKCIRISGLDITSLTSLLLLLCPLICSSNWIESFLTQIDHFRPFGILGSIQIKLLLSSFSESCLWCESWFWIVSYHFSFFSWLSSLFTWWLFVTWRRCTFLLFCDVVLTPLCSDYECPICFDCMREWKLFSISEENMPKKKCVHGRIVLLTFYSKWAKSKKCQAANS